MLPIAAVAALVVSIADVAEPTTTPPSQVRYIGETMSYSLHAVMSQSIAGDDAFGRRINQTSAPTSLKLHERISITKTTSQDLGMHRLGSITATVAGAKPVNKDGQGWTTINSAGVVIHDSGKLGGLFLLPLPFLADAAMHGGQELTVGDTWSGQLGTKLYGMTARPRLKFSVTAERLVGNSKIYSIEASGTVPMKEAIMTASGEPLGYATGIADITAHIQYDRANRRLISMRAQLTDMLRYKGPTAHTSGHVKDHQLADISLDQESVAGGQTQADDPSPGPQP